MTEREIVIVIEGKTRIMIEAGTANKLEFEITRGSVGKTVIETSKKIERRIKIKPSQPLNDQDMTKTSQMTVKAVQPEPMLILKRMYRTRR